LNGSYISIGGALLLTLQKNGSRSLPFSSESSIFADKDMRSYIDRNDRMYIICWGKNDTSISTDDGRIIVSTSQKSGLKDLNRLKCLAAIWNKKFRLSNAVRMIPMWGNDPKFSQPKESNFLDQQEKWMRVDKKVDLFLDIESKELNKPILSNEEKRQTKLFVSEIADKDIGLYEVAAQVDSLPKKVDDEHLAFLPAELSIVNRIF